MAYQLIQSRFSNNAVEGHSPRHCWSLCFLGGRTLTEPGVCQALCRVLRMDQMGSKSPPTVTHPLLHVPPEKQKQDHELKDAIHGAFTVK